MKQFIDNLLEYAYEEINENSLKIDDVLNTLPSTIPFEKDIYLTGGLTRIGYTAHDVDILLLEKFDLKTKLELQDYFFKLLKYNIHIIMNIDRNYELKDKDIYVLKIYNQGQKINF